MIYVAGVGVGVGGPGDVLIVRRLQSDWRGFFSDGDSERALCLSELLLLVLEKMGAVFR